MAVTSIESSHLISFTNTSTNATSYSWDFGDDTSISTETNPEHLFYSNGPFTVVLTASGVSGVDTDTQILDFNPPTPSGVVDFSWDTVTLMTEV